MDDDAAGRVSLRVSSCSAEATVDLADLEARARKDKMLEFAAWLKDSGSVDVSEARDKDVSRFRYDDIANGCRASC